MLRDYDAGLLIGDAALQVPLDAGYHLYDLAHEWRMLTGKPFVFAFWAVRLDALNRTPRGVNLARVFQASRDHGLEPENIRFLAQHWAPRLDLPEETVHTYLTQNIHYFLDRENHSGLQLFYRYSQEIGLIPALPQLRFLGPLAFGGVRS
jgi:chorismate dehydratase